MIRFAFPALLLGGALFSIQTADGHCYRYWHFRQPQTGCGAARHASQKAAEATPDHSWYVEVSDPLEADQRTPEQIQDFDEHYEQLAKHHDEINGLMIILHTEEDAARAAGLKQ